MRQMMNILGIGEVLWSEYDQIAKFVNALEALVASQSGTPPRWTRPECLQLINSYRGNSATNLKTRVRLHFDSCRECQ